MEFVTSKGTWVEAHERKLRILLHCAIFLILAPAYGSYCLPLFDYPIWHDHFGLVAFAKGLSGWDQANRVLGSQGRFAPLFFLIQGLTLHFNRLPQLSYWILAMASFQISSYLLYNLIRYTSKSSRLALAGCVFFVLNPYTVSTYWTAINTETSQIPFVLAFLICSYRFFSGTGSRTTYVYSLLFYALALFSKESTVFLLPAVLLQALFAVLLKISPKKDALSLVIGSLVVTALWWVARLAFVGSSASGMHDVTFINFLPLAVLKRLLISTLETIVSVPGLGIAVIFVSLQIVRLLLAKSCKQQGVLWYPSLFLLLPLATWLVGISFISHTEVRYLVPLIALGAAVSVQPLQSMERGLRRVFWVIAVVMLLNSAASAFTAREVQTAWNQLEGAMIRSVNELPEKSVIFCGATYQSSDIRFAQRITWSLDRFFGRRDISVQPLSGLSQPPVRSYLVISDEQFVSQWLSMGWHPGGLPDSTYPTNDMLKTWGKDKSVDLNVQGWQLRGWHLLVLAKQFLNSTPTDLVPVGPTLYKATFRFYRHPSLSLSPSMDLRPLSIKDYVRKGPAERALNNYRLLDGQE
jgi:hypothetical protein